MGAYGPFIQSMTSRSQQEENRQEGQMHSNVAEPAGEEAQISQESQRQKMSGQE